MTPCNENRLSADKSCAHIHVRGKNARHEERQGSFAKLNGKNLKE
jgi:hypothetical protein